MSDNPASQPSTLADIIAGMRKRIQQILRDRDAFLAQANKQLGAFDGELTALQQTVAKLEALSG